MEMDSRSLELMRQQSDLYENKREHSTQQTQYQLLPKQEEMHQRALNGAFLQSYRHLGEAAVNPIRQLQPARGANQGGEQYLWQLGASARSCGFRDKGQHLLVLWLFIRSLSLRDLGLNADAMDKGIRAFWLRAAAALRDPTPSSSKELEDVVSLFLKEMFKGRAPANTAADGTNNVTVPLSRESSVIHVVAHLFLHALTSCTIQRLLLSACTMQSNATSKPQLQERFVLLLSDLYDALDGVLGEVAADMVRGNQALSMPALSQFAALRVEISSLLLSQEVAGSLSEAINSAFQTFVALAREAMIVPINMQQQAKNYAQQQKPFAARPGYNDPEWNQRWLLEPGSLQMARVESATDTATGSLGLADFAQIIYEFGGIDVSIAEDMASASLQSAYSLSSGATATPMTLVLDGKLRVFRALPSGMSSMVSAAGGWSLGDYMATISDDAHILSVDFFLFADVKAIGARQTDRQVSRNASQAVVELRRVGLTIKLEEDGSIGEAGDLFAFVHGTAYSSSYTHQNTSVTQRLQALKLSETSTVDRATVWREAKWAPMWKLQAGFIALPRVGFV
ncbi:hypothetical protein PHYSODRAFT_295802 [Phytophthora sojae]|uniref:Uncharacterized protein n=1 Tax=Phytophthora sojae (strain P6497) TaxID=1094619 RepID=G4Z009_PHYSP|nr:hypothetical protein PHYSODRAFT_295802 [Phytophthora sojae]EGZ23372.1 hypothetical protein PHYSODRAFT_295802 [Phytophthora sojae]|eukprot:XP_009518660.1 hypothetical protein PHYSODRAFT_295802 [Phytophthora sojae]